MTPTLPLFLLVACFGLILGSFFNVVIYRLPRRLLAEMAMEAETAAALTAHNACEAQAISSTPSPHVMHPENEMNAMNAEETISHPYGLCWPASYCPHCQHPLRHLDKIPVYSFFRLRGKCRHCQMPIHWQYPLVETLSALFACLCLFYFGLSMQALLIYTICSLFLISSAIDTTFHLLPDGLTYSILWLGLCANALGFWTLSPTDSILGAAIGYLSLAFFATLYQLFRKKIGLGQGDFKYFAAIGAWVGPALLPIVLSGAALFALTFGVIYLRMKKQSLEHTPIFFGPFLGVAGIIALFEGPRILNVLYGF